MSIDDVVDGAMVLGSAGLMTARAATKMGIVKIGNVWISDAIPHGVITATSMLIGDRIARRFGVSQPLRLAAVGVLALAANLFIEGAEYLIAGTNPEWVQDFGRSFVYGVLPYIGYKVIRYGVDRYRSSHYSDPL